VLINLLPHRTEAQPHQRARCLQELGVGVLAGLLLGGLVWVWQTHQASEVASSNAALQARINEAAGLEAQLAALHRQGTQVHTQLQVMQALQDRRSGAAHVAGLWVPELPVGVVMQSLRQEGDKVWLQGLAIDPQRVSDWLQQLNAHTHAELLEIKAAPWRWGRHASATVSRFSVRLSPLPNTRDTRDTSNTSNISKAPNPLK
jgi:type IV pilus assembly protein PilN